MGRPEVLEKMFSAIPERNGNYVRVWQHKWNTLNADYWQGARCKYLWVVSDEK
jgi:hypothetical protein